MCEWWRWSLNGILGSDRGIQKSYMSVWLKTLDLDHFRLLLGIWFHQNCKNIVKFIAIFFLSWRSGRPHCFFYHLPESEVQRRKHCQLLPSSVFYLFYKDVLRLTEEDTDISKHIWMKSVLIRLQVTLIYPLFLTLCFMAYSDKVKYIKAKAAAEFEMLLDKEPALEQRWKQSPRLWKRFQGGSTRCSDWQIVDAVCEAKTPELVKSPWRELSGSEKRQKVLESLML